MSSSIAAAGIRVSLLYLWLGLRNRPINAVSKCAQIDLAAIQDKLDAYTWTGIFKKVREAYLSCLI
jgi:hypothetical protein